MDGNQGGAHLNESQPNLTELRVIVRVWLVNLMDSRDLTTDLQRIESGLLIRVIQKT